MSFRNIPPCNFSHISAKEHSHAAFPSFKDTMRDMSYGREELNQAWYFYKKGWEAFAVRTLKKPE